eukprot:1180564-Amphidinium_carterae.1
MDVTYHAHLTRISSKNSANVDDAKRKPMQYCRTKMDIARVFSAFLGFGLRCREHQSHNRNIFGEHG